MPSTLPREEFENHEATGIELDPDPEGREEKNSVQEQEIRSPYDPSTIRVDTKVYSIRQILDMIDEKELDVAPEFQRDKVWKPHQKSFLIESLLLRIPLPAFYFSSDGKQFLQVVDGIQRLTTIHEFARSENSFPLNDLEYLNKEVKGKKFKELESVWQRRILSTQITANVIDPQTPAEVKFDIFRRINTMGSPLAAQEIRHCMSTKRSREFLKELSQSTEFKKATGDQIKNSQRMADREIILRSIAFKLLPLEQFGKFTEEANSTGSMESFLLRANRMLDDPNQVSDNTLKKLKNEFLLAMENSHTIFGEHAFRKWYPNDDTIYPFNRSLFDVWSVELSRISSEQAEKHKNEICQEARLLMYHDEYFNSCITSGTSSQKKVNYRFEKVQQIIDKVINA